jgi:hypothetical protein
MTASEAPCCKELLWNSKHQWTGQVSQVAMHTACVRFTSIGLSASNSNSNLAQDKSAASRRMCRALNMVAVTHIPSSLSITGAGVQSCRNQEMLLLLGAPVASSPCTSCTWGLRLSSELWSCSPTCTPSQE